MDSHMASIDNVDQDCRGFIWYGSCRKVGKNVW